MSDLLASETKALQSIQRLKFAAQRDSHAEKSHHILELMSQPHRWQLANGSVAQVQTPATLRAKELLDLYRALSTPVTNADIDGRLDILLHVKVDNLFLLCSFFSYFRPNLTSLLWLSPMDSGQYVNLMIH